MAATVAFLATDDEQSLVLDWFQRSGVPFTLATHEFRHSLLFYEEGEVAYWPGEITIPEDASPQIQKRAWIAKSRQRSGERLVKWEESPVVVIELPHSLRGVLRTVGEVTFTASNLRERFPRLGKLNRQLRAWLGKYEHVYGSHLRTPEHGYYLEAGILNRDIDIFALPGALESLKAGQYFVPHDISNGSLHSLCQQLRLRGVACTDDG